MSGIFDQLWSGWRYAYVSSGGVAGGIHRTDSTSIFSQILASGIPDDEALIVHRGPTCFAILNRFPYSTGHTLVLPYREVPDLEDLTAEEIAELWASVTAAVRALKAAYRPDALNIGINLGEAAGGSVARHLHVHIVPRWSGDSNFMTATAYTRTIPEALPDTWAKVRAAWVQP
ncbi:MAG: HIT domain-containing protein [Acidimicrobiia bacterium]